MQIAFSQTDASFHVPHISFEVLSISIDYMAVFYSTRKEGSRLLTTIDFNYFEFLCKLFSFVVSLFFKNKSDPNMFSGVLIRRSVLVAIIFKN